MMNRAAAFQKCRETLLYTFIFGLIAHAYMYFDFKAAHDSMMLVMDDTASLISLGRFVQIPYVWLRGRINAPWFLGVLQLLFLGFAIYFLLEVLRFEKKGIRILTCGLLATSLPLISTNLAYIGYTDRFTFTFLCCMAGVYLLERVRGG